MKNITEKIMIQLKALKKNYLSAAGSFEALRGIDKPTSGEILIGNQAIQSMNESQMAKWRGTVVANSFAILKRCQIRNLERNSCSQNI